MDFLFIIDPADTLKAYKDTSVAMMRAAQARGHSISICEQTSLAWRPGGVVAEATHIVLSGDDADWYRAHESAERRLAEFDAVLMRKDPPFDMDYIFTTYLLELAEQRGVLVVNKPQSLRDANEKLFTLQFPQCTPPTLVSCNKAQLRDFLIQQRDIILKPLEGMGGASIFRVREEDANVNVIIETLTNHGQRLIMAQRYIPEISYGDKRILLIDGEAIPYALARIPAKGETRANLAVGGEGVGMELTERDHWICQQVGPTLRDKGLLFVGIDVIGDYLTEINVTSPTCIRELDKFYGLNISARLFERIETHLRK